MHKDLNQSLHSEIKQIDIIRHYKNLICRSAGDSSTDEITLGTSPRQISPRENKDRMVNIVVRTHAQVIMNRERKKL